MDQEQKRIGNMFEFFITCGLRNMDEGTSSDYDEMLFYLP